MTSGKRLDPQRYWTPSEDAKLRQLRMEGYSAALIGDLMGRNRNEVLGRAFRLGLPRADTIYTAHNT